MDRALLKIGQLAKLAGVLPSTIHYYTSEKLIAAVERSQGGYRLYHPATVQKVQTIQKLQSEKRLTISEIRQQLTGSGAI